jgi:hypothetical protein
MDFLEFPLRNDDESISGLRGPFHIGAISIAEDGALLDFWMSHASGHIPKEESMQVAAASLVAWTTVAMLNCANIGTVEHRAPDAFQKARIRTRTARNASSPRSGSRRGGAGTTRCSGGTRPRSV